MLSLTENYGDTMFGNLNLTYLYMDNAYLTLTNMENQTAFLYSVSSICLKCPYFDMIGNINKTKTIKIHTQPGRHYKVLSQRLSMLPFGSYNSVICDVDDTVFGEFGVYHLKIGKDNCTLDTLKQPVNIYLPIITVFFIYFLLFLAVMTAKLLLEKINIIKVNNGRKKSVTGEEGVNIGKNRMRSLDAFRGFTLTLMIFVNYGAGGYYAIKHVPWFGLHLADLLYPWFLWIMGVCVPLSMKSKVKRGDTTQKALLSILKRACLLYALGVFLLSSTYLKVLKVCGVLQRLAFCYLVHATLCFLTMKKELQYGGTITSGVFEDIAKLKFTWPLMMIIWVIHTLVVFFVPFGKCPSGYFGPGGYHDNLQYRTCTGGITGHVDRMVLKKHISKNQRVLQIYHGEYFDTEGILGTVMALVHVCLGVQAGSTLLTFKGAKNRITRWIIWGVITGLAGGILCEFSEHDGIIPLSKSLWTTSFMLVTCSFAFFLLAGFYAIIDVARIWDGKPFIFPGMNSILMYGGHYVIRNNFPVQWHFNKTEIHFTKLTVNVWSTILWILIAYWLYKRKYFLKI